MILDTLLLIIIAAAVIIIFTFLKKSKDKKETVSTNNDVKAVDKSVDERNKNVSKVINKPLIHAVLNQFTSSNVMLINAVKENLKSFEELKDTLFDFIKEKYPDFNNEDTNYLFSEIKKNIWGYGILQELVDDDDISDIKIINENNIRIKKLGRRLNTKLKFYSKDDLEDYVEFIARRNSSDISDIHAIQRFTDSLTSPKFILRIDIATSYVNSADNSYMHIRKIPKNKYLLDDLYKKGMFNNEIEEYLRTAAKSDLGILVCGKGGSGKTFLINAVIEEIPDDRAGLIVQEAEELFSNKLPEFMFQKIIANKGEGNIEYTLSDLIRNGLVSDQDYIGVGEIKGPEAWDLINAAYTGHIPIASVHTVNAKEAPSKLVHYMKYSPNAHDMAEKDLIKTLVGFDVIIFMKDFRTMEITEISGYRNDELKFNPVFKYNANENKFIRLNQSCKKVQDKIDYRINN